MNDATPTQAAIRKPAPTLDRVGATGSLLCAIHCALLPMLIAVLPSLGIAAWLGEDFERGFVAFATLLLIVAFSFLIVRGVNAIQSAASSGGALFARFASRQDESFAAKVNAALRNIGQTLGVAIFVRGFCFFGG